MATFRCYGKPKLRFFDIFPGVGGFRREKPCCEGARRRLKAQEARMFVPGFRVRGFPVVGPGGIDGLAFSFEGTGFHKHLNPTLN